jgi:tRNA U34 5-carboxymethylaminomethyl modifying enzyme MnmG/GidA
MSNLGVEIIDVRELSFLSDQQAVNQCSVDKLPLIIEQNFSFTLFDIEDKEVNVNYFIQGFLEKNQSDTEKNKNVKNEEIKDEEKGLMVFSSEIFCLFKLDSLKGITIEGDDEIKGIEHDLLRLLMSVSVGTCRGILALKSLSLPEGFLIPIIDLEELEKNS